MGYGWLGDWRTPNDQFQKNHKNVSHLFDNHFVGGGQAKLTVFYINDTAMDSVQVGIAVLVK